MTTSSNESVPRGRDVFDDLHHPPQPEGPPPDPESTDVFKVRRVCDNATTKTYYASTTGTMTTVWILGLERRGIQFKREEYEALFEPAVEGEVGQRPLSLRDLQAALRDPRFAGDAPTYVRVVYVGRREVDGSWITEEYPITGGLTGWADGHVTLLANG